MSLTRYAGPAEIYFGSILLVEVASSELTLKSNNHAVKTMHKGLSGVSPGVDEAELTLENAVPRAGVEFDFDAAREGRTYLTVHHRSGALQRTLTMWIDELSEKSSTDNEPKLTAKLMGKLVSRRRV